MAVENTGVPQGVHQGVNLLLTDPFVGDPSFVPGSIAAASSSSFSSGLPVYPTILEGPSSAGNVSRLIVGAQNSENQSISMAGSGNGFGMLYTQAYNYSYDPATVGSNRDGVRGTGGQLVIVNPLYSEGAATSDDGERSGQDVRAFLYAEDQDDVLQAVRLQATAAGALTVDASAVIPGTITTAVDVVLVAATPTSIIAANAARSVAIVQNVGANPVRVGGTTGAAQGIELAIGESVTLETTAEIFARSTVGSTVTLTEIEA